jgi:uncharacterized protein YcgI (DUF1989 family)
MNLEIIEVPPASARAVRLGVGDTIAVIDVEGSQVGDLVAFFADEPRERLSQGFTRLMLNRVSLHVGDQLLSCTTLPMLTLVEDTVGVHDLLFPPCNTRMYESVFGIMNKTGCREHLTDALTEYGFGFAEVTDPFNIFMHTQLGENGEMEILPPLSGPGDRVVLRAEADLVVAVSSCASENTECNGGMLTPLRLEIVRAA